MHFSPTTSVHHGGIHRLILPVKVGAMTLNHPLPICHQYIIHELTHAEIFILWSFIILSQNLPVDLLVVWMHNCLGLLGSGPLWPSMNTSMSLGFWPHVAFNISKKQYKQNTNWWSIWLDQTCHSFSFSEDVAAAEFVVRFGASTFSGMH
jgi:hypothetical protein